MISTSGEILLAEPRRPRLVERASRLAAAVVLAVLGAGGLLHVAGGAREAEAPLTTGAARSSSDRDSNRSRAPLLGPGLLDAHWVGARRPDIELPPVIAAEPEKPAPRGRTPRPGRSVKIASSGGGSADAADEVEVVLEAKHGRATIVVGGLARERAKIEAAAQRLRLFEAMAGAGAPVLASLPAIDSMDVETTNEGTRATVFVREVPAPEAGSEPRSRAAPKASSPSAESDMPAVPASLSPDAPSPAPEPARIVGKVDIREAIERARKHFAADVECAEEIARRARERAAAAKRQGTTS